MGQNAVEMKGERLCSLCYCYALSPLARGSHWPEVQPYLGIVEEHGKRVQPRINQSLEGPRFDPVANEP